MDPAAQTPNTASSDDMMIKLQKQLDDLKQGQAQQKTAVTKQKQDESAPTNDITAEDILNTFNRPTNSNPVKSVSSQDSSGTISNITTSATSSQTTIDDTYGDDLDDGDIDNETYNQPIGQNDIVNKIDDKLNNTAFSQPSLDPSNIPTDDSTVVLTNPSPQNNSTPSQISTTKEPQVAPVIQPIGSMRKEAIQSIAQPETVKYQEISTELTKDVELEKWMKEVPDAKTVTLPKPVADDYGQILVQAAQIPKPKIVLPISEPEMEVALHHRIVDSFRWLYEWAKRLILLQPGRVFYPENKK